jgi:MoaA/NifB/PqqE/SkfB family radical SAM enzyme
MRGPSIIVLFTSYRCNARCVMCSAWAKQKEYGELTPQDVRRIFSDKILKKSVRVVNITGGEPTLRDDLPQLIQALTDTCVNLERIDISTNGIDTEGAVDRIEQILAFLMQTRVRLSASVSIDGVDGVHEKVRRVRGAFEKSNQTIDELKELMRLYPSFSLGLNFTVNRINSTDMEKVLIYSAQKALGLNFTLAALSEIGVASVHVKESFAFTEVEKRGIKDFIQRLLGAGRMYPHYGRFLLHWLETGERTGPCAFRKGMGMLCEPDGSAYMCGNFKDFKIGNLLSEPFSALMAKKNDFTKSYRARCKECNSNCYIDSAW